MYNRVFWTKYYVSGTKGYLLTVTKFLKEPWKLDFWVEIIVSITWKIFASLMSILFELVRALIHCDALRDIIPFVH